ncbi:MAG: PorV/PorQ family protein, partial [candidate division FCPU426 bacterium]
MKRLAACLWALQASAAFGGPEGVGTTSADFLKIPAAARPAAMGEAFAGLADDESSLTYNPSGIARPLEHSLSATHVEWFQGIRLEHLGGVLALGEQGGLAVDLSWLQVDAMARTLRVANSADPLSNYAEIGSFSPHDAALGLGYARPFGKSFNTGLSAHFIQQNIDAQNGYGLGLDLGAQWLGLPGGLDLGLVIKHLGTPLALGANGSQLPLDFRLGALKRMKGLPLLWSAELGIPVDGQLMPGVGVEGELYRLLALRAGWRGGYANQFSAGLGFKLAGFKLDYAWVPFELLGPTHRLTLTRVFSAVSLGLDLDRDLIGPLGDV